MLMGHSPIREHLIVCESPGYPAPFLHMGTMAETHQAGTTGCMDSSHLRLGVEGHSTEWVPRGLGLQLLALHHRLSSHAKHLGQPWSRSSPSSLSFDLLSSLHLQYFICWIPLCHTWGHSQAPLHCSYADLATKPRPWPTILNN